MKSGKVSGNVLKRSVLGRIGKRDEEAVNGAGLGKDCAVFPSVGESSLVSCVQEAVLGGTAEASVTLAELIQKCANNLAAGGAVPLAVMIVLFLPEDSEETLLRSLMEEAEEKCRELSIEIAGGQSRITGAVSAPVGTVTGYGKPFPDNYQNKKAEPGQDVILSKWIGLQGTAMLAKHSRERLRERYPAYFVEEAEGFGRYLSVLPEAAAAVKYGVCAMHDASEGGIFGALWELAEGAGIGLQIDMRKIPLRQETVEVCECCNVNPYELMSGGCLVMTAEDGFGLVQALAAEGIPAAAVGKVTAGKERILRNGEEIRYLNRPERDGIYGCCERQSLLPPDGGCDRMSVKDSRP